MYEYFKIKNLCSGYGKKQVLYDVSLDIKKGETILLVGSNGSGKSTLLKAIYGLIDVWSGTVEYNNWVLQSKDQKTPTHKLIEKGIMYIPQKNALFEDMTVEDNIKASLLHFGNNKKTQRTVLQVLEQMPDLNKQKKQFANRLSGGERKQLSLAMVIANAPQILLYDEPLAGVSKKNIPKVMHCLRQISDNGTTMLIVEHRVKELMSFADTIIGLKFGCLHTENLFTLENIKSFMI